MPLTKSASPTQHNDLRQIRILPTISEPLEMIWSVAKTLDCYSVMSDCRTNFRKGNSCVCEQETRVTLLHTAALLDCRILLRIKCFYKFYMSLVVSSLLSFCLGICCFFYIPVGCRLLFPFIISKCTLRTLIYVYLFFLTARKSKNYIWSGSDCYVLPESFVIS